MKQDFFLGPLCTIGLNLRFNDNIFFKKQIWQIATAVFIWRADQESNWFSVIMYRPTYALPFFYDLKINIPLSGPPTQSLTAYLYMIIGTWWFQKMNLVGWLFFANEPYSPLGAKMMRSFETSKNNSWD